MGRDGRQRRVDLGPQPVVQEADAVGLLQDRLGQSLIGQQRDAMALGDAQALGQDDGLGHDRDDAAVESQFADRFSKVTKLFTVQQLGGWDTVQKQFFKDGAIFDKIQKKS